MGLWATSVFIFNSIREHGPQSVRRLADHTGLSKSSVHRHLQAIGRRDRYPESSLWETEAGRTWLIRLVVATLFVFGFKRGGGADTLIEAVDDTFLQRMMLVFMALASGYLLMEEVAVDRTYDTWYGFINGPLKMFGVGVLYLVSDRAKALVKLAQTGLDCLSIPDLFHLSHELAKGYSLAIFSRLRQAQQALAQARQRLEALPASEPGSAQVQQAQASVEACETVVTRWQGVRSAWRQSLSNLSRIMHPWRLVDSSRQTSQEVERQLQVEIEVLETLFETNGLPVKKDTLDKVRKQLAGVSSLIDFWWQTVWHDLEQMAMTPGWTQWVEELLLPLMYWQERRSRTRCPVQKAQIALVLQAVQDAFERHPCTGQLAPRCWQAGNRGQASMPGPSSGHPQRLKVATAICLRCSIITGACPCVATRYGQGCTTLLVAPRTERHQPHGFSGGSFLISLRACYRRSMRCPCPGNAIRSGRSFQSGEGWHSNENAVHF